MAALRGAPILISVATLQTSAVKVGPAGERSLAGIAQGNCKVTLGKLVGVGTVAERDEDGSLRLQLADPYKRVHVGNRPGIECTTG